MFVISNIVGSTIQITTLPLPVLSTLQAVRMSYTPTPWATLMPLTCCLVRSRLQYYLRYLSLGGTVHPIFPPWYHPRLHRRRFDRSVWRYWGTRTHSRPAARPPVPAFFHPMDG